MSFSIKVVTTVTKDSEDAKTVASRTFSNLTEAEGERIHVLNNSTEVIWDASASGALADFDLMVISTDVEVELEMTINNGDAAEELNSLTLAANTALVLGSDAARYNHSASDAFAGTLDVIDLIRAKELNSVSATVTSRLYT